MTRPYRMPKSGESCPFASARVLEGPERLVGLGFRCWLAGYNTADIGFWETAWNAYSRALGAARAKSAMTELGDWVRLIHSSTRRDIEVFPAQCRIFCPDECLAVGMVAASQHGVCPIMRVCAVALLNTAAIDAVLDGARSFAAELRMADQWLSPAALPETQGLRAH